MTASSPPRPRVLLFAGLDVVLGCMVGAFPFLVPGDSRAIDLTLAALGVLMVLAGPALVFGGRPGRLYAIGACLAYWLAGAVLVVLLATSAAWLWGIYEAMGEALAMAAVAIAVLVMVVFWLVPGHQLAFLRRWSA